MHGTFSGSRSALAAIDPALERLVNAAQQYLENDPYSALVKLRNCAECLQQKLAGHYGIALVDAKTGYDRSFADVRDDLKAYIDDSITNEFFRLYKDGSEGAHFPPISLESARSKAHQCIQRVHTIANWYIANFQKPAFSFGWPHGAPMGVVGFVLGGCAIIVLLVLGVLVITPSSAPNPSGNSYQPIPSANRREITSIQIGQEFVGGALTGAATEFEGNPARSIALVADYKDMPVGLIYSAELKMEGYRSNYQCGPMTLQYTSGQFFCEWHDVVIGNYDAIVYMGDVSLRKSFSVVVPRPHPTRPEKNQPDAVGAPLDLTAKYDEVIPPPQPPQLRQLRTLQLWIAPYIPQHVIFDDADTMIVQSPPGIRVLREGAQITGCGGGTYRFTQHGMYSFDSCGSIHANVVVTKYVRQ
jgi:hypothetical protein